MAAKAFASTGSGLFLLSVMHFDSQSGALIGHLAQHERHRGECLHRVLAELGDEAIAHGGGLQRIDGFVQIEFAGIATAAPWPRRGR